MPAHKKEVPEPTSTKFEAWRACSQFTAGWVKVSTAGRVWLRHKGILLPYISPDGYYTVHLFAPAASIDKHVAVHRLVCQAFCSKPTTTETLTAAHLDGNKFNNCVSNLAWVTSSENRMHHEVHQVQKGIEPAKVLTTPMLALIRHVVDNKILSVSEVAAICSLDGPNLSNVLRAKGNTPSAIRRRLAQERLLKAKVRAKRIETVTRSQAAEKPQ